MTDKSFRMQIRADFRRLSADETRKSASISVNLRPISCSQGKSRVLSVNQLLLPNSPDFWYNRDAPEVEGKGGEANVW